MAAPPTMPFHSIWKGLAIGCGNKSFMFISWLEIIKSLFSTIIEIHYSISIIKNLYSFKYTFVDFLKYFIKMSVKATLIKRGTIFGNLYVHAF